MAYTAQNAEGFQPVKEHLLKFSKPNDLKAWQAIAMSIIYELLAAGLIMLGQNFLGWALHAANQVRLFIQFHDMAHFSFFTDANLNKLFGRLIGIYVHFPFQAWRDGHNHHHKHFGNIDRLDLSQTILFTKKQYQQMPTKKKILVRIFRQPVVFFILTSPYVWFIGLYYVVAKRYGILSKAFAEKIMSMVLVFFIFPALGLPIIKVLLSTYIAQVAGTVLFHLQHSVNLPYRERKEKWDSTRAALEGSTFLDIPLLLKPFTNGIQYHHIHHLNTNVASYAISDCHNSFEEWGENKKHWDAYNINRVDQWTSLKSMINVMLDEENKQLIPFSYRFWSK